MSFDSLPASLLFVPRQEANKYGSGLNEFLPSGMDEWILRDGPRLTLSGTWMTLTLKERRNFYEILACTIPTPKFRPHVCTLRLKGLVYECTLEWLPGSDQGVHSDCDKICILIEKPYERHREDLRGSCFYILDRTIESRGEGRYYREHDEYFVTFCCRMRLKQLGSTERNIDSAEPVFEGSKIRRKSKIKIVHCRPRSLLQTRRLRYGGYENCSCSLLFICSAIFLWPCWVTMGPTLSIRLFGDRIIPGIIWIGVLPPVLQISLCICIWYTCRTSSRNRYRRRFQRTLHE
ncbi:hypothetical protein BDV96DRAFT_91467 [Lophiotrema nucula]|uniref:Uncharacterized protein n=1 Tax=Lophiotrema nucula TaxID=690887 RepID=A0A6A5Z6E9_9PLEO|nr:hypothetical protein BDV96DRAFT_91467 [Lophiotrema nucula]